LSVKRKEEYRKLNVQRIDRASATDWIREVRRLANEEDVSVMDMKDAINKGVKDTLSSIWAYLHTFRRPSGQEGPLANAMAEVLLIPNQLMMPNGASPCTLDAKLESLHHILHGQFFKLVGM
jgi:hypothetical protein